jgi:isochorismate synthase
MKITSPQSASLTFAAANNLPYAFWRSPGCTEFTVLISNSPPRETAVFNGDETPGFVVAPFDCADGNQAWHFAADVLMTAEGTEFLDGTKMGPRPTSEAQERIAAGLPRSAIQAKAIDGDIPKPTTRAAYEDLVSRAVARIDAGHCEKIVLSRVEPRGLSAEYDLIDLAERLAEAHPHALVCVMSSEATGTWLVATPEILLTVDNEMVHTMALAGTQWPPEGTDLAAVEWTDKIVLEQKLVSDFIRDAFKAEGVEDLVETAPATVRAANLCHLRSEFRAPPQPPKVLAGLLSRLHPTSAVCGMPKPEAREFILSQEGDTRGMYTGYFGPTSINGRTELYVNLRSARVIGPQIFLHVGGGIVGASDPALEWEETVAKTKTIAQVL